MASRESWELGDSLVRPKNEARGSRALAAPLGALASCARWGAAQVTRQGAQQLDRDGTLGEPCAAVLHEYRWLECAVHQPCVRASWIRHRYLHEGRQRVKIAGGNDELISERCPLRRRAHQRMTTERNTADARPPLLLLLRA